MDFSMLPAFDASSSDASEGGCASSSLDALNLKSAGSGSVKEGAGADDHVATASSSICFSVEPLSVKEDRMKADHQEQHVKPLLATDSEVNVAGDPSAFANIPDESDAHVTAGSPDLTDNFDGEITVYYEAVSNNTEWDSLHSPLNQDFFGSGNDTLPEELLTHTTPTPTEEIAEFDDDSAAGDSSTDTISVPLYTSPIDGAKSSEYALYDESDASEDCEDGATIANYDADTSSACPAESTGGESDSDNDDSISEEDTSLLDGGVNPQALTSRLHRLSALPGMFLIAAPVASSFEDEGLERLPSDESTGEEFDSENDEKLSEEGTASTLPATPANIPFAIAEDAEKQMLEALPFEEEDTNPFAEYPLVIIEPVEHFTLYPCALVRARSIHFDSVATPTTMIEGTDSEDEDGSVYEEPTLDISTAEANISLQCAVNTADIGNESLGDDAAIPNHADEKESDNIRFSDIQSQATDSNTNALLPVESMETSDITAAESKAAITIEVVVPLSLLAMLWLWFSSIVYIKALIITLTTWYLARERIPKALTVERLSLMAILFVASKCIIDLLVPMTGFSGVMTATVTLMVFFHLQNSDLHESHEIAARQSEDGLHETMAQFDEKLESLRKENVQRDAKIAQQDAEIVQRAAKIAQQDIKIAELQDKLARATELIIRAGVDRVASA